MNDVLKNTVRDAFSAETPDLRERIVAACQRQTQAPPTPALSKSAANQTANGSIRRSRSPFFALKAIATATACLVLFISGLILGNNLLFSPAVSSAQTLLYLDVNPSIELSLDKNERVASCMAANDDAEKILDGMDLSGVELKTALNALIGSMYVNGYLAAEENSILVSVDAQTETERTGEMLTYITDHINGYFKNSEMSCSIIAQTVSSDDALKERALANGVSVGKMHLIDKIIGKTDDLNENNLADLSKMSIKELNLIYALDKDNEKPDENGQELISGNVNGYVEKDAALTAVLAYLNASADDVVSYKIRALPTFEGEKRVYYVVTLKLKNDETEYRYEVDCETGNVYREYTGYPNEPPEENGGNGGNGENDHDAPPEENPHRNPNAPHSADEKLSAYHNKLS